MAIRFIFGCMMFILTSFAVVPVFTGIANERAGRVEASMVVPKADINDRTGAGLSFEEIYALVESYEQDDIASVLNDVAPGAGGEIDVTALKQLMAAEESLGQGFSEGFATYNHPAL